MVVLPLKPTSPHPMSSTRRRRTFGKPEAALEEVKRRQRRAKSSFILKSAGLASFSAPAQVFSSSVLYTMSPPDGHKPARLVSRRTSSCHYSNFKTHFVQYENILQRDVDVGSVFSSLRFPFSPSVHSCLRVLHMRTENVVQVGESKPKALIKCPIQKTSINSSILRSRIYAISIITVHQ